MICRFDHRYNTRNIMQGIVKLLKLEPAKSAGPDNIPTRILKNMLCIYSISFTSYLYAILPNRYIAK